MEAWDSFVPAVDIARAEPCVNDIIPVECFVQIKRNAAIYRNVWASTSANKILAILLEDGVSLSISGVHLGWFEA